MVCYGEADLHGVVVFDLHGGMVVGEWCTTVRLTCMAEWLLVSGVVRLSEWCAMVRLTYMEKWLFLTCMEEWLLVSGALW